MFFICRAIGDNNTWRTGFVYRIQTPNSFNDADTDDTKVTRNQKINNNCPVTCRTLVNYRRSQWFYYFCVCVYMNYLCKNDKKDNYNMKRWWQEHIFHCIMFWINYHIFFCIFCLIFFLLYIYIIYRTLILHYDM